jgi:glycerophosphoryl diester phosphodiesterase
MNIGLIRSGRAVASLAVIALVAFPGSSILGRVQPASAASFSEIGEHRPSLPPTHRVLVIAHRGFSDVAPENTLPAMRAAADAHADMVEFDVQRTLDGHLIVVHDTTFARTTNIAQVFPNRVSDPVGSFTLAEVQQLDAGSWKGARFAGTRVPTLEQLLTTMLPTSTNLLLELKNPSLYPGYERQVAATLAAHGFGQGSRVYVHSFDHAALDAFHAAAPSVPLGLLTMGGVPATVTDRWLRTLNPASGSVTDLGVDEAGAAHLEVFAWTPTSAAAGPAQIERLVDDGVRAVITDNPVVTRQLVSSASAPGA